jgi:hypothetical protein
VTLAGSHFFSGYQNQEIGQTFLFKGHKIETCSYFGVDSAIKKSLLAGSYVVAQIKIKDVHSYCMM